MAGLVFLWTGLREDRNRKVPFWWNMIWKKTSGEDFPLSQSLILVPARFVVDFYILYRVIWVAHQFRIGIHVQAVQDVSSNPLRVHHSPWDVQKVPILSQYCNGKIVDVFRIGGLSLLSLHHVKNHQHQHLKFRKSTASTAIRTPSWCEYQCGDSGWSNPYTIFIQ